jgi:dipeptidyl aminopeptidase/acylaminoacyl peptidase
MCGILSLRSGIALQRHYLFVLQILSISRETDQGFEFSTDDKFIYFTAGDNARIKVFVLPLPPTPHKSTVHLELGPEYPAPVALMHSGAASGLQIIPNGRLIFSQSSFTSPNDVYIIRNLQSLQAKIRRGSEPIIVNAQVERVTRLTEASLERKDLAEGEEFWFKGAENRTVQGWVLKPKGWARNAEQRQ